MSSIKTTLVSQRSDSLTGSKLARDSTMSHLNKPSSLHSLESRSSIRKFRKDDVTQSSTSTSNTRTEVPQKRKKQSTIDHCLFLDCSTMDSNSKVCLQELENKFAILNMELCEEKNENHLLRRDLWMAKKVVQREIGGNSDSFESLLQKASNNDWLGRQKRSCILKRKLRDLNKIVEELADKNENISLRKELRTIRKESPISVIPEERQLFLCLELERKDVFRSVDCEKKRLISDRDLLKNKLETLSKRNKILLDELKNLQEKIKMTPERIEKGLTERLRLLEKQLKFLLHEKVYSRKQLEDFQHQICSKTKDIHELRAKLILERQIAKDQEALLESLKTDEINYAALLEEIQKGESKEIISVKNKLEDVENDYSEMKKSLEHVFLSMSDSKQIVDLFKRHHADHRFIKFMGSRESDVNNRSETEIMMALHDLSSSENGLGSSVEIFLQSNFHSDVAKPQKYRAILEALESKNRKKSAKVNSTISEINENTLKFLKDINALRKLECDISALKNRIGSYRKIRNCPLKLNLIKKKNSTRSIRNLDLRRQYLKVLQTESRIIKALIKRIRSCEHADFSHFEAFLCAYKIQLLNEISKCEL